MAIQIFAPAARFDSRAHLAARNVRRGKRRQLRVLPLCAAAIGVCGGVTVLPVASADPPTSGQHTVTFQILGAGDVFSAIPDPGTPVYPKSSTTWVSTPWAQTVQVSGGQYLALNYTDHTGVHDCAILVDGHPVPLTEHTPGRCAYQMPG
jgi:hypothetical protein